ncbi:MAG TPA: trehalose-phosphatase [Xanthobacteraceae bacterium]|nr:trehalose-phosphatase [Xanthobacteraceae bacterium]
MPALDRLAILLDVDGTILDLAPTPSQVEVPEGLRSTLTKLLARTNGALALVSGRPLADIDRIFAPLRLPAIGGHGAEIRRTPDSPPTHPPLSIGTQLKEELIAAASDGVLVEDKGYSIALHYRQVPESGDTLQQAVAAIVARHPDSGVEILRGKRVIEVKPARFTKGSGIRNLMNDPPFHGRTPFFVGDDVTDEAAFAVLPQFAGTGYSVGRPFKGVAGVFEDAVAVRDWLDRLLDGAPVP